MVSHTEDLVDTPPSVQKLNPAKVFLMEIYAVECSFIYVVIVYVAIISYHVYYSRQICIAGAFHRCCMMKDISLHLMGKWKCSTGSFDSELLGNALQVYAMGAKVRVEFYD